MKAKPRCCRRMAWKLSDFIDGAMGRAQRRHVASHARTCKPCKDFIRSLDKTVWTLRRAGRSASLPPAAARALRAKLRRCRAALHTH